ncbi:S24 family peptidase [Alisedimentitalea sp. MJ-SS2]|uniref:XRE family transcriptional regulator n=1 Tax=Aliisedimentitalea sp. MJ-SS2 TaxID=3049795 RepID=UPI00290E3472|nr:S24 family peptidase [Alisedimentitalea sp. MJ-SS2]MDU8929314.1 S24 family peptidase [Alisedimentitalea sp. MJ-SS2]
MSEIGGKIRSLREDRGLSRKAFGERTGVPEAKVQAVEIGKQRADHEFLMSIVRVLGVDANWLLSEQLGFAEPDKPGFGTVRAGRDWAPIDRSEAGDRDWFGVSRGFLAEQGVSEDDLLIVTVVGNSMEPKLSDGNQVLVNCAECELKDGLVFVLRFGDEMNVKQVQMLPQAHVQLVSANAEYPPILVDLNDTDMVVIGRVMAAMQVL